MSQGVPLTTTSPRGDVRPSRPRDFSMTQTCQTQQEWSQHRRWRYSASGDECLWTHPEAPKTHPAFRFLDWTISTPAARPIRKQVTICSTANGERHHEDTAHLHSHQGAQAGSDDFGDHFSGNQSCTSDPGVKGATLWLVKPPAQQQGPGTVCAKPTRNSTLPSFSDRGYGFAHVLLSGRRTGFQVVQDGGLRQKFFCTGPDRALRGCWDDRWHGPMD